MHHRILLPAVCCVAALGAVVFARHERAQTTATARAANAPTRQENPLRVRQGEHRQRR